MTIEIVDFPIKNGDFPVRYVKLPEGIGYDENCNSILVFYKFFLTHQLYARNEMHLSHLVSVFFLLTYPTEHIQA